MTKNDKYFTIFFFSLFFTKQRVFCGAKWQQLYNERTTPSLCANSQKVSKQQNFFQQETPVEKTLVLKISIFPEEKSVFEKIFFIFTKYFSHRKAESFLFLEHYVYAFCDFFRSRITGTILSIHKGFDLWILNFFA